MQRTISATPVVNTLLRGCSLAFLRLTGWKVEGSLPPEAAKSVLIAAPHTSNWDLPYTLMVAFALRLNPYWMGKHSLFKAPFGPLMRWLGGIAVSREQASNLVAALLENRLLLHRAGCPSAHRHALYGLQPQAQRLGPAVCAQRRF